jgi:hypothetical protein
LAALAVFALGGCTTTTGPVTTSRAALDGQTTAMDAPAGLAKPGTRLTIRNPDAAKWMVGKAQTNQQTKTITSLWMCRPLACAGKDTLVAIQTSQSPTRSPQQGRA